MPSDETRRLLKLLGVAVTTYEDAILNRLSEKEIREFEADARARLQEVTALLDRLRAESAQDPGPPQR
jgi:hypothetical protein